MSTLTLIQAWSDPDVRAGLDAEVMTMPHPAGDIESELAELLPMGAAAETCGGCATQLSGSPVCCCL